MNLQATHILLCLHYGIGDLIMELPVLDGLRDILPQATITGLGAEPAVEILEGDDRMDHVVSIQHWGIRHLGDPADEHSRQQFAHWLQVSRFDLILDPSHAANTVQHLIYQQDTCIMDSDRACVEVGLTQGMDGLSAVKHGVYQGWGLEVPASSHPAVRLHFHEVEWASRFLQERDLAGNIIAISPGASDDLKRWPIEHFARLCRRLVEELDACVLVFCGPGETKLLRELREHTGDLPSVEIVQNVHLRRVAALLSQCVLYLGNDSGLMHLAAAVDVPVVIVFGPTVPQLYLPGWVHARAVASEVPCPYRPRRAFGHPRCVLAGSCLIGTPCVQTIDPTQVYAAVQEEYAWHHGSQHSDDESGP